MANFFNKIWYHSHFLRYVFLPITALFYLLVQARLLLYRLGLKKTKISQTPVVAVGNISVGGTGKTPFIIHLTNVLQNQGIKVAIVSKGYGRQGNTAIDVISKDNDSLFLSKGSTLEHGDEPVLVHSKTGATVVVANKRAEACDYIDKNLQADVILSDDGMQHYQMARASEWCLVDAQRGFGNKWLLPAGPLREPMSRLKTVDAVIQQTTTPTFKQNALAFCLTLQTAYLLNDSCQSKKLSDFISQPCIAIAGIANPQRFFNALKVIGLATENVAFEDHHQYQQADFDKIDASKTLLMTEKDAIKCTHLNLPNAWVVPAVVKTSKMLDNNINQLITAIKQKRLSNG